MSSIDHSSLRFLTWCHPGGVQEVELLPVSFQWFLYCRVALIRWYIGNSRNRFFHCLCFIIRIGASTRNPHLDWFMIAIDNEGPCSIPPEPPWFGFWLTQLRHFLSKLLTGSFWSLFFWPNLGSRVFGAVCIRLGYSSSPARVRIRQPHQSLSCFFVHFSPLIS